MTTRTNDGHADAPTLKTGRDGRRYRASAPSPAERARARRLAHKLVCELGLSIRAAQALMAAEHGVRRSRGAVWEDVAYYECPACANRNADTRTPHEPMAARTPG